MAKEGFGGQFVEICRVGATKDASGVTRDLSEEFLKRVIANYNTDDHEAPIVIGHPADNAPAFGWVTELRLNGDRLEARFSDTSEAFEKAVRDGEYRKRSASFYLDPANLRHVGFLGAQPPAVKGLRNIQFSEGEAVTVISNFKEEEKMPEQEEKKTIKEWFQEMFGGGAPAPSPIPAAASFSEAKAKTLISEAVNTAVAEVKADFKEQIDSRDAIIESLKTSVNSHSASGRRAEIESFFDKQGANKITPALKRLGIVEFAESLAIADAADKDKAVICFAEGEDGKPVEHKLGRLEWFKNFVDSMSPFVSFGESFGGLKATSDVDESLDESALNEMRGVMGIKNDGGEK